MQQSPNSKIDLMITSRERDLGGFSVRRLLPSAKHRMVGPFIFFDHMGPAEFAPGHGPGHGIDVRPHPHINLATVTFLFEGQILHRDSLGSNQVIEPGAVNWMTAGRGIVHSERSTDLARERGSKVNGIQLWVALPDDQEECDPSFSHHPRETFQEFKIGDVRLRVILGEAFGRKSPVQVSSKLFYVEANMPKGSRLKFPSEGQETAFYVVNGSVRCEGEVIDGYSMVVTKAKQDFDQDIEIEALEDSRLMLLGGKPVGPRFIFWNFVSSSQARIEEAKKDWERGPRKESLRFKPVPGDHLEFIPLPDEPMVPKTIP